MRLRCGIYRRPSARTARGSRPTQKDFVLARNTDGEFHLVLFFDLYPDAELRVTVRDA